MSKMIWLSAAASTKVSVQQTRDLRSRAKITTRSLQCCPLKQIPALRFRGLRTSEESRALWSHTSRTANVSPSPSRVASELEPHRRNEQLARY